MTFNTASIIPIIMMANAHKRQEEQDYNDREKYYKNQREKLEEERKKEETARNLIDVLGKKDLGGGYFLSGGKVYFNYELTSINPSDIKILKYGCAQSGGSTYYYGKYIRFADSKSFRVLDREYSVDSHHVYYKHEKIEGVDISSFNYLGSGYISDKNNVYFGGKKIDTQTCTFSLLNGWYAKDGFNVYYIGKKITVKDLISFHVIDSEIAKDRFGLYIGGKLVKKGKIKDVQRIKSLSALYFDFYINIDGKLYFYDHFKDYITPISYIQDFDITKTKTFYSDEFLFYKGSLYFKSKLLLSNINGVDIDKIKCEKFGYMSCFEIFIGGKKCILNIIGGTIKFEDSSINVLNDYGITLHDIN